MSKPKVSIGGRSAQNCQRSFSYITKAENTPFVACQVHDLKRTTSLPSGTINFRQMIEDAAKMQEYIALMGGKKNESSRVKFIKKSGLFDI